MHRFSGNLNNFAWFKEVSRAVAHVIPMLIKSRTSEVTRCRVEKHRTQKKSEGRDTENSKCNKFNIIVGTKKYDNTKIQGPFIGGTHTSKSSNTRCSVSTLGPYTSQPQDRNNSNNPCMHACMGCGNCCCVVGSYTTSYMNRSDMFPMLRNSSTFL